MKKILDYGLCILALVAIVLILWIKIDLPKIPVSFLANGVSNAINDIILNLSYGYLSGIIIYWLTAYRPQLKQRELIMKSVNFIIFNFTKNVVRDFLILYWGCKESECKSIYEFADKMGDKYIFRIRLGRTGVPEDMATNDSVYRDKLKMVSECRNELRKTIGPYVSYLSENQQSILNEVILDEFDKDIKEPYEDGVRDCAKTQSSPRAFFDILK